MTITTKEERSALWAPRALSIDQFCAELGLGRTKVYGMLNAGKIRSVWIGSSRRIPVSEVDRLINSPSNESGPPKDAA